MTQFIQNLSDRILNPHPRVKNPEKIQRTRLLSAILLIMITIGLIILTIVLRLDRQDINEPEVRGAIFVLFIAAGMYFINRLGYNRLAISGIIGPFTVIFILISFSSSGKSVFLAFLMVPILLTAIFFPLKWTIIISGSILALISALLSTQDQVSANSPFWTLRAMWFFLFLATGLVITFMWHLGNLEKIRQDELMNVNSKLEREFAELEQFTYTVSHDLKKPVITIKGFLGLLEKDLQENRTTKVSTDFNRVKDAANKMQWLISDLIEFSKTGYLINTSEKTALFEVVQEAKENVGTRGDISRVRIDISPNLPILFCDRARILQVFEHLIDNAVKFMGAQTSPLIEIGMTKNNDIFVKDNGIGIEPQHHSKIFGLFEKLDPTSEGTGIGLALIKRIVEYHGGKIRVESEGLGKGSTFLLNLPDKRPTKMS